jgi:hypothetical protein
MCDEREEARCGAGVEAERSLYGHRLSCICSLTTMKIRYATEVMLSSGGFRFRSLQLNSDLQAAHFANPARVLSTLVTLDNHIIDGAHCARADGHEAVTLLLEPARHTQRLLDGLAGPHDCDNGGVVTAIAVAGASALQPIDTGVQRGVLEGSTAVVSGAAQRGVELLPDTLDGGHEGRARGHVDDARLSRGRKLTPVEGSLLNFGAYGRDECERAALRER